MDLNLPLLQENNSDIGLLKYILRVLYDRDCDSIAERLINKFGSFQGAFGATAEELLSVKGMTERACAFFEFVKPAFRQAVSRASAGNIIDTEDALARFLLVYFLNRYDDGDYCLYLSDNCRIIRCERLIGDTVREAAGNACRYGAYKALLVGYKPHSQDRAPSLCKLMTVKSAMTAFELIGTELLDYVEYSPFKLFGLKRAAVHGGGAIDIADATKDPYTALTEFSDSIDEYIELRGKHICRAYLDRS